MTGFFAAASAASGSGCSSGVAGTDSSVSSASGFTENTPVGILTKNDESAPAKGPLTSKAASPSGMST